ncbi:universal stress protein [Actinomadura graeca]|uniref:Universal stress protein n=1 Tax=Actinomadura graeca TaxID=2750812 RepID=A0ABX8QMT4_9ACTN|nr:universal stress protein [Actinomadura graeca]QXJ19982.1 universal stress protein [Actinomadura graeca]
MSDPGGMHVLVGYSPDERGGDALALGALVVRAAGGRLTVANVHPPGWRTRGPGSVDAEWVAYLRERSDAALARAAGLLGGLGVPPEDAALRVHAHRGSGRGLIEVAADTGADLIVIGSAPRGRRGRIAIGSTADQLLHGSPVPVLLAPRGYAAEAPPRFSRLTVAYWHAHWRRQDAGGPLAAAAGIARRLGLPVRLVTLVLRPPGLAARLRDADELLARQLTQAQEDLAQAAALFTDGTDVVTETAAGTGIATTVAGLDMPPGEILACMSGHDGPLRKVFLGEGSGKIVRASPCPVLVLPRGAAPRPEASAGR